MAGNNNNHVKVPGDLEILLPWLNIVRRAKQVGSEKGPGIVKFLVVVDEFGNPLDIRTTPVVITLEPKVTSTEALVRFLEALAE